MKKLKSRFPYGFAGWLTVQTVLAFQGAFDPVGAIISLALIFAVIVGTEELVWWIWKRRNPSE